MTVPDHSWQGHTVEYTVGVQNHYQYGGNITAENAYYGTAPFHNKLPSEHFENKNRPFDHGFYHLEESWLAEDTSSPDCPSQTSPLENFVPPAWDLGDKDIQSIFNDYYYDSYLGTIEMTTFRLKTEAVDTTFDIDNEGSLAATKQDPDSPQYWDQYYNTVRASEQWQETELTELKYVHDVDQWLFEPEELKLEDKILEPEIVMAVDQQGRTTPMASGIMVVKSIQGRACSRLLRVLYDSG